MIDWVSIVRHSRRRFSDYVYGVPIKVRKRRTKRSCHSGEHVNRNAVTRAAKQSSNFCGCCWNHVSLSEFTRLTNAGTETRAMMFHGKILVRFPRFSTVIVSDAGFAD